MVFYATFNITSVISQLALFMYFLGFTSTRLGLFPKQQVFGTTKLKALADNELKMVESVEFVLDR